jgi:hypothetical protein
MSNNSTGSRSSGSSRGRDFRRPTLHSSGSGRGRNSSNSSTRGGGSGRSQPRAALRERLSQQAQLLPSLNVTTAAASTKRISASPPMHSVANATTNHSTVPLVVNTTTSSRGGMHTTSTANPEPYYAGVVPTASPSPKTTPVVTMACPYLVHLTNSCQEHLDSVHNQPSETLPGSDNKVGDTNTNDTTETCRLALDSLQRLLPAVEASLATTAVAPPNDDIGILCDFYNNTMAGGFCPDAPNLWKDVQHGTSIEVIDTIEDRGHGQHFSRCLE